MKIKTNYKIAGEQFEFETTFDFGVVRGIKASGRAIAQGAKSGISATERGSNWVSRKVAEVFRRKAQDTVPAGSFADPTTA